jgi:hypothetical protein
MDDTGEHARVRNVKVLVVGLVVAGCDHSESCSVESVMPELLTPGFEDCGYLSSSDDELTWQVIQTCVDDHQTRHLPFIVRQDRYMIDYGGTFEVSHVGRDVDGLWTVSQVDQKTTFSYGMIYLTRADCEAFVPIDCPPSWSELRSLCFECVNPQETFRCDTNTYAD